ncbi:hypothetical protein [Oceanobacillus massiliensis]|uniref:hypothetical protein n=1 Tax=Oceanobacillus massiliensis TaxID=1465765 RepID=UPI0011C8B53E
MGFERKNATGKTTLLRHILQQGKGITISPKAVIGYYQQMANQFHESRTVPSYMNVQSDYNESKIRSVLHSSDIDYKTLM